MELFMEDGSGAPRALSQRDLGHMEDKLRKQVLQRWSHTKQRLVDAAIELCDSDTVLLLELSTDELFTHMPRIRDGYAALWAHLLVDGWPDEWGLDVESALYGLSPAEMFLLVAWDSLRSILGGDMGDFAEELVVAERALRMHDTLRFAKPSKKGLYR